VDGKTWGIARYKGAHYIGKKTHAFLTKLGFL